MKLFYWTFELPFQYSFTISQGRTKTHQPTLIVALQNGKHIGYGEAPAISYYNVTTEQMVQQLQQKINQIEGFAFTTPDRYWHYLHHLLPNNNFIICALDIAAWDLFGKMQGLPLYQLWNTEWKNIPLTDYTIGIDSIDKMVEKMKAKPWPIYKIKLGTKEDIEIVSALRNHTNAIFRVDANAAWTTEEALQKIPKLAALGVELIEQPLAKDNWEGMKELFQHSPLPLIADESCVAEHDVQKCHQYFHGINIKLTKCGGLTPALRMIQMARSLKMKVMMGSMNECSIGTAAIAQCLPQLDYVDMDGPLLLSEDKATGLLFHDGIVEMPTKPGLGIEVADDLKIQI